MKKSIIALSLLAIGLCSCNSDEVLVKPNPGYMEEGYAGLTLRLTFPDASTKAVGDTLSGLSSVSYTEEKLVNSVAFFVQTNDEGSAPNLKVGAFSKFFSTDDLLSGNGLNEPLLQAGDGEYTASIKIKSEGWGGNTKVIVIANYAENGLTDKLKAAVKWADLEEIQSNTLVSNPITPLLMYATKEVQMTSGDTKAVEFNLDRMVSRVDILNKASNADESKGFVLVSAQFINPKQSTYLLPGSEKSKNIPVVATDFLAHKPEAASPLKIDSLYTYENANDGITPLTAIRVNGVFKGTQVSKVIDFRRVNGLGAQTDTIGLARNRRYLINITPTPDSLEVEWTVKVAEWEEADTIRIQPSTKVPDIEALAMTGGSAGDWNATTKTYTVPTGYTGGTVIKFTAACSQSPEFKMGYKYIADGSSFGFDNAETLKEFVEEGEPVITYAAAVTREYTLNIPAQTLKVPADLYVRIVNSASDNASDTIKIVYRPNYDNTALKPVLMLNGKYWAPVNLGATTMPTSVPTTANQDITATCGQLFQWGRKQGFAATNNPAICIADTANVATVGWPTQANLGAMETTTGWQNKFIVSGATASHGVNTMNNWLRINPDGDNPTSANMVADAWYQKLWDANAVGGNKSIIPSKTDADPCPAGWRVPSIGEWEAIGAGNTTVIKAWSDATKLMTITGVGSDRLILPAAGFRSSSSGASSSQGALGYYWSSSVPAGTTSASYVLFNSATLNSSTSNRATGFSVRCVQE